MAVNIAEGAPQTSTPIHHGFLRFGLHVADRIETFLGLETHFQAGPEPTKQHPVVPFLSTLTD